MLFNYKYYYVVFDFRFVISIYDLYFLFYISFINKIKYMYRSEYLFFKYYV